MANSFLSVLPSVSLRPSLYVSKGVAEKWFLSKLQLSRRVLRLAVFTCAAKAFLYVTRVIVESTYVYPVLVRSFNLKLMLVPCYRDNERVGLHFQLRAFFQLWSDGNRTVGPLQKSAHDCWALSVSAVNATYIPALPCSSLLELSLQQFCVTGGLPERRKLNHWQIRTRSATSQSRT